MARFHSPKEIEEYRECFYLNARTGALISDDQLSHVMRSLGLSPTRRETTKYFQEKATNNRVDFAGFLDIMHQHNAKEDVTGEVIAAFKLWDRHNRGYISARDLKHILSDFGDKLTKREVTSIMNEANIQSNGQVRYAELLRLLQAPPPDYL
ncbi:PREDICTED: calmodulin-like [Priapulus caudatus]|uniref:Calmodulin-like n=1 Tax=Priapulus caudatus TaxID=37621 RepID=A0ABM1DUU4_PRICU|nr:PREDICTED: calmodulin-like [Priapulus caudatus]